MRRHRTGGAGRRPLVLAATLCTLLVTALSSLASIGPFLIRMESWSPYYRPFEAQVAPHSPVKWTNPTASPHTIRHDGCASGGACAFDSGAVPPDGSYVIPGLPAGRYPYHCAIHPIMRGELIVDGSGPQVDHRS